MMEDIRSVTFILYQTGEIKICADSDAPAGDDTLTLEVAMRDETGAYLFAEDADRLAECLAQRVPSSVPGGRL